MEEHPELRARLNDLVDALVAEGRYQTAEDVIDAIAALVAEREKKVAALCAAIDKGEASGFGEAFDLEDFHSGNAQRHGREERSRVMSRLVLAIEVRSDLAGIWRYSARQWGDDQAERYVRDIWSTFEKVAENPKPAQGISRCWQVLTSSSTAF